MTEVPVEAGVNTNAPAEAFHPTGAVEVWGRGTNRVIAECKAHGILPPSFEERQGWMVVTFRAPIAPVEAEGGPEGGTEKSSEKILDLVRQNPAFSAREIAEALGLTSRAVEKQLGKLKKEGRLKRIGPDKGGHWEVVP